MNRVARIALAAVLAASAVVAAQAVTGRASAAAVCTPLVTDGHRANKHDSATVPVLFVHGINTTAEEAKSWADPLRKAVEAVTSSGTVDTYLFDYHAQSLQWITDAKPGSTSTGARLAKALMCLAHAYPGRRVIAVGYSMGGLALRYAAAQPDGSGTDGTTVADHLAEVITVATPNTGSFTLSAGQVGAAASWMTPEVGAAVDTVLTLCSWWGTTRVGASPSTLPSALADEKLCRTLAAAHNTVGTALQVNSKELAALPQWSPRLHVHTIAADIRIPIQIVNWKRTLSLGDAVVWPGSAQSGSATEDQTTVVCTGSPWSAEVQSCFHTALPSNVKVTTTVARQIESALGSPLVVDWLNASYNTNCAQLSSLTMSVTLKNQVASIDPPGNPFPGVTFDYYADPPASGDLTGDHMPEVVVILACVPPNYNYFGWEAQIFTGRDQQLADLVVPVPQNLYSIDYVPGEISIEHGKLTIGVHEKTSHVDGAPNHRLLSWTWNGTRLVPAR